MAKKEDKIEEKKEVKKESKIKLVDHDFGREDMNELRDKLNEVIRNI